MCGEAAPREARCQAPTEGHWIREGGGCGVVMVLLQPRTSPVESAGEGKRIAIEEQRERRPDVKAAGCRGEDGERDPRVGSWDTAPPGDPDES